MSEASWVETLAAQYTDGTPLSNTVTATSILHGAGRYNFPANWFEVGKTLRLNAAGRISTVVTTPGTLTFGVRLGPTANIVAVTTPAFALNTVAKTNVSWYLQMLMTCRSVGASTAATLLGMGTWESEAIVGSAVPGTAGSGTLLSPASAPAAGTGFDSTVANLFDLFATWSVANAANSIQTHLCTLEAMN